MQLDERLGDCEPEAGSADLLGLATLCPPETVEGVIQLLVAQANVKIYVCPSDPTADSNGMSLNMPDWGASSYAFNAQVFCRCEPSTWESNQEAWLSTNGSGILTDWFNDATIPTSFPDGLSNTILLAEKFASCSGQGGALWDYFDVDPSVVSANALTSPDTSGVQWNDMVTVSLGGTGTIENIINGVGATVNSSSTVADLSSYN